MIPNLRTGYSFRHAAGTIPAVMDRLQEIGATVAPITDRASTFGFAPWRREAKKRGLRPVYGVELAVSPDPAAKKPVFDYWTFYAVESLRPINELVQTATHNFRYNPLLNYETALNFARKFPTITGIRPLVLGDDAPLKFEDWPEHLHFGLSPGSPVGLVRMAVKAGVPITALGDNRFVRAEDRGFYETLSGRHSESHVYPQHILTPQEWRDAVAHHGLPPALLDAALARGAAILDACHADLATATLPVPPRPDSLLAMCEAGAAERGVDLTDPVYSERLEKELRLIHAKGFDDYFYIVSDVVAKAKAAGIVVGPGRGSSAGSLVCYLLGITGIDPIPFGLIFERFIDINRSDNPDIDIDFSYTKRDEVFGFLRDQYGLGHVARLGTVNYFQARSALDETAGSLGVAKWETDKVKEALIERPLGDPRAEMTLQDTFNETMPGQAFINRFPAFRIAERIEGHPRHAGQHAAAVVISQQPILDIVAVDDRNYEAGSAVGTTMCDKNDAEKDYGLLKIDALGLVELSVFESALENIFGHILSVPPLFLEKLPLDDQLAFEVLNRHSFNGIFQWGAAVQQLSKQIQITEFNDIVALNALARPGPLKSGSAQEWIDRRNGRSPVRYPHPAFEPILKETLGVIIYQEQVMRIARDIGKMSWERVTELRKAISKSQGRTALAQFEAEFMAGCIENEVPVDVIERIWREMLEHGAYSFNKSHAVAYAMIAYWGCWLKAHHPFEFAAANLTHRTADKSQLAMLREMRDMGMDYIPVDPERSTDVWTVTERGNKKFLLGPLQTVIGLGPKTLTEIMSHRKDKYLFPLSARAKKLLANPKTTIDSLEPIMDRIKELHPDRLASGLITDPKPVGDILDEDDGQVVVWARADKITVVDENRESAVERRGYRHTEGPLKGLSLIISDDTGEMFAKVDRYKFETLGIPIVNRGRAGNSLYIFAGKTFPGARVLMVERVKYLGDMVQAPQEPQEAPPAPDPEERPTLPTEGGEDAQMALALD